MCSKDLGADVVYDWLTIEIAVMGPDGAAGIIFKKKFPMLIIGRMQKNS
jgi:methylmalonyl-CoA carboxyltransferase large subunit